MAWKLAIKENPLLTMVKNTNFVVPVADGHLKRIQNNLLKMTKVEILTTPGCTNCSVVEKMLDEMKISYQVIDVTEKPEYLDKYQIFTAPCVVIDGKLEFIGIPKKQELKEKLLKIK